MPPPTRKTGEPCEEDLDCISGACAFDPVTREGYCTTLGCQSDADCVNESGDSSEMCCVEDLYKGRMCDKTAPGYACGARDRTCGEFCDFVGGSACEPGLSCVYDMCHSCCVAHCTDQVDCDHCFFGGLPDDIAMGCIAISGGDRICYDTVDRYLWCRSMRGCCELRDERCAPTPTPDGASLEGNCGVFGLLETGQPCDYETYTLDIPEEERCIGGYCLDGLCSEACEGDEDCPAVMICEETEFALEGPEHRTDTFWMCRAG